MRKNSFGELTGIMKTLRGKNGCPWDRKQSHKSLTPYLIEETYELLEAINSGQASAVKEELGDVLLQVVFHAQIASEKGLYDIDDVIRGVNEKLISRHPHVFAGKKGIKTPAHVRQIWEKNKKEKKKRDSIIDGVPVSMPRLLRARRLVSKAGSAGFKWEKPEGALKKTEEEFRELKNEIKSGKKAAVKEELGDLLFALCALSYYRGIDPEDALRLANNKFIKRFKKVEKGLKKGIKEKELTALWEKAKK